MTDSGFWVRFLLAALAAWRVTHLLAAEDGPADLIARFRARLGRGRFGRLLDCFQCLSFWVAAPLAFLVGREPLEVFLAWPALSGAACLLERVGRDPVVFQSVQESQPGDENHGMLRRETGNDAERQARAAGAGSAGQ